MAYSQPNVYDEDSIMVKKNGEPFTGKFIFKNATKKKLSGLMVEKKGDIIFYSRELSKRKKNLFGRKRRNRYRRRSKIARFFLGRRKRYRKVKRAKKYGEAYLVNGSLNGWIIKDKDSLFYNNGELQRAIDYENQYGRTDYFKESKKSFVNGKLHGDFITWDKDDYTFKEPKPVSRKYPNGMKSFSKDYIGLYSKSTYENGKLVGVKKQWSPSDYYNVHMDSLRALKTKLIELPFQFNDSVGTVGLVSQIDYKNGEIDGLSRTFEEGGLNMFIEYKEGTKNGLYLDVSYGDTLEYRYYDNCVVKGNYYKKYDDGGMLKTGIYTEGKPDGEWKFYSKYGKENAVVRIDSLKHPVIKHGDFDFSSFIWSFDLGRDEGYSSFELDNIRVQGVCGDLTLYHSNEQKLAEGQLMYGGRTGASSFWNEHGEKMEENHYQTDTMLIDSNKFPTMGDYTLFNVKGDTIAKGKLLSGVDLYDCSSDLDIREYDRTYDVFVSNNGDTLVKNGEGHIKFYNEFNVLLKEGPISKSIKHGHWKFYDPNGNLSGVGDFNYGEKDGIWYEGDLRAIQYKNPDCFVKNEEYSADKEMEEVKITRTIFKNGVTVNKSTLTTYRRK